MCYINESTLTLLYKISVPPAQFCYEPSTVLKENRPFKKLSNNKCNGSSVI